MNEQERFDRCLAEVLRLEGGYVDNPRDHGGATNHGVTRAVLSESLGRPATDADVEGLTVAHAAEIYRRRYWGAVQAGGLPAGVDLVAFDTAVNMGPLTAGRLLQGAVGVNADGVIGPDTLAHVSAAHPADVIRQTCDLRRNRYRALTGFATFGVGWLRRVAEVEALALSWAGIS